jgi:heptosyltransferase-2/heptosyltransferase-3
MTLDIKALCSHQQQVYCVADELPLRRLLALLSLAHSCISVDTGPAHAAAALDCPLTVLFGQADARRYQPLSSTSKVVVIAGRNHAIELLDGESSWQQAHDIKLIPIDDVVQGWIHCTQPN